MVQVNHAIIALSIALNIVLAGALYSIISSEESPDPEILFFEPQSSGTEHRGMLATT